MTRPLPGKAAKITVIAFFGAILAVMLGFGVGWIKYDRPVPVELNPSISFAGTINDSELNLSREEVESLNTCLNKWKKFSDVFIHIAPGDSADEITQDTRLDYNVNIRTSSDINIFMRPKAAPRKNLVPGIVRRVDNAGQEFEDVTKGVIKKSSIKNIYL